MTAERKTLARSVLIASAIGIALAACDEHAQAPATPAVDFAEIEWKALIPPEEIENYHLAVAFSMRNIDHNSEQRAAQFGSFKTVAAMEGRAVSLAGYVVPLDTDDRGRMTAFFFVPTMGACIHVPPPPPDQMVYVTLSQPMPAPEPGDSRWLRGTLHTQTHDADLASAAYSMQDAQLAPRPLDAGS
ncbi:MAG TPA: DUF3299 domain-containing protein [Dokdonella sp.]